MYGKLSSFKDETDILPMRHTDDRSAGATKILFANRHDANLLGECGRDHGRPPNGHCTSMVSSLPVTHWIKNFLFRHERDHCQTLTSPKDSSLTLTGPSRAIVMVNPVIIEAELKVKGEGSPSEDKVLSQHAFCYHHIIHRSKAGFAQRELESTEDTTLEFMFAHLRSAVEATITVHVVEGLPDFKARFTAHTAGVDEAAVLLDSQDGKVVVDDDGYYFH